jgi:hypothetical protein
MISEANLQDVRAWDLDRHIIELEEKFEQLDKLHHELGVVDMKSREQARKHIQAYYDMKAMFAKELGFRTPGRHENFRVVVLVEEIEKSK